MTSARGWASKRRVQFTPSECEGHPDGPVMGETFYCDGSCVREEVNDDE